MLLPQPFGVIFSAIWRVDKIGHLSFVIRHWSFVCSPAPKIKIAQSLVSRDVACYVSTFSYCLLPIPSPRSAITDVSAIASCVLLIHVEDQTGVYPLQG
jgi:hypothetical protein